MGDTDFLVLRDGEHQRLASVVKKCISLDADLRKRVGVDWHAAHKQSSSGFQTRSTVGLMLLGCQIDNLLVGGSAFASGKLARGDTIKKVDGKEVTNENVTTALIGRDVPGSTVTLTVNKGFVNTIDVELARMPTELVADRRKLFETFTQIKSRATTNKDSAVQEMVDHAINLWTKMTTAETERERKVNENVGSMQADCEKILDELRRNLDTLEPRTRRVRDDELPDRAPKQAGIGLVLRNSEEGDAGWLVDRMVARLPAKNSGKISKDDVLLDVGGERVSSLTQQEISKLIVGPEGSKVVLTFKRAADGATHDVELVRGGEDGSQAVGELQGEIEHLTAQLDAVKTDLDRAEAREGELQRTSVRLSRDVGAAHEEQMQAYNAVKNLHALVTGENARTFGARPFEERITQAEDKARALCNQVLQAEGREQRLRGELGDATERLREAESRLAAATVAAASVHKECESAKAEWSRATRAKSDADVQVKIAGAEALKAKRDAEATLAGTQSLRDDLSTALEAAQALHDAICGDMFASLTGGVGLKLADRPAGGESSARPIEVVNVIAGGPAAESGKVKVGDVLVAVDGRKVGVLRINDVRRAILGPAKSSVALELRAASTGKEYAVTLARQGGVMGAEYGQVLQKMRERGVREAETLRAELAKLRAEAQNAHAENNKLARTLRSTKEAAEAQQSGGSRALQDVRNEASSLRSRLENTQLEGEQLREQARVAAKELAQANGRVAAQQQHAAELNRQIDALRDDVYREGAKGKTLKGDLEGERTANLQLAETNRKLAMDMDAERTKIKAAVREAEAAKREAERLEGDAKRLALEIEGHPAELRKLKDARDAAYVERDEAKSDLERSKKEAERAKGLLLKEEGASTQLRADADRLKADIAKERERTAAAEKKIGEHRAELGKLAEEVRRLTGQLAAALTGQSGAEEGAVRMREELRAEQERAARLVEELAMTKARADAAQQDLARALAKDKLLSGENDALKGKYEAELKASSQLRKDLADEHVARENAEKELKKFREMAEKDLRVLKDTAEKELKNVKEGAEKDLRLLKDTAERELKDQREASEREMKIMRDAYEQELRNQRDAAAKELGAANSDLDRVTQKLADSVALGTQLQKDLTAQHAEAAKLKEALQKAQKDLERTAQELAVAIKREEAMAASIAKLNDEQGNLGTQFADLQQELRDTQAQRDLNRREADAAHEEHSLLANDLAQALAAARKMRSSVCLTEAGPVSSVGIEVGPNGDVKGVNGVSKGRLTPGDRIATVNGKSVAGFDAAEVKSVIIGPVASPVTLAAKGQDGRGYRVTLVRGPEDAVSKLEKEGCDAARALHLELQKLRDEVGALVPRGKADREEIAALKAELERAQKELAARDARVRAAQEEAARAQEEGEGTRGRLAATKSNLAETAQLLAAAEKDLAHASGEASRLAKELEEERKYRAQVTAEKEKLSSELKSECAASNKASEELAASSSELEKARTDRDLLRKELADAKEELEAAQVEAKRLGLELASEKKRAGVLEGEVAQLTKDVEKAAKRITGLDKDVADARAELAKMGNENDGLRKQGKATEDELAKVRRSSEDELAKLLRSSEDKLAGLIGSSEEEVGKLKAANEALCTELTCTKADLQSTKEELVASEKALKELKTKSEQELAKAKSELARLLSESEKAMSALKAQHDKELTKTKAEAEASLKQLKNDSEKALQHVKSEADKALAAQKAQYEKELAQARSDAERAKSEAEKTLSRTMEEAAKILDQTKDEAEKALKKTRNEADSALQKLQAVSDKAIAEQKAASDKAIAAQKATAEKALADQRAESGGALKQLKSDSDKALQHVKSEADKALAAQKAQHDKDAAELRDKSDKELAAAKAEGAHAASEMKRLTDQLSALTAAGGAAAAEVQKLNEELAEARKRADEALARAGEAEKKGAQLGKELAAEGRRTEQLQKELAKAQKQAQQLDGENAALKKEQACLAGELAAKAEALGKAEAGLEGASSDNEKLTARADQLSAALAEKEAEAKQLARDLDKATKEVARLEGDNGRLLQEIEDHPKEKAEAKRSVEEAHAARNAVRGELEAAQRKAGQLQRELEEAVKELTNERATMQEMREAMVLLNARDESDHRGRLQAERELVGARSAIDDLKARIGELEAELEGLKEDNAEVEVVRKELGAIKKICSEVQGQYNAHKARSAAEQEALQAKVESLQKELQREKNGSAALEAEIKSLQQRVEGAAKELASEKKRAASLEESLAAARAEIEKAARLAAELRTQLDAALADAKRAHDEVAASREAYKKLADDLAGALHSGRNMRAAVMPSRGGEDGGVGVQIAEKGGDAVVHKLLPGEAAKASGRVAEGDVITCVNGQRVAKVPIDDVRAMIMGPVASPVVIEGRREGKDGAKEYVVALLRSGAGTPKEGPVLAMEKETCEAARAMHDEIAALREQLDSSLPAVKSEIDGLQRSLSERSADLNGKLGEMERLKKELDEANKALEAEKRTTAQLREDASRLESAVADERAKAKKAKEESEAEKRALKKEHDAAVGALRAELDAAKKEAERLRGELDKAKKEADRLHQEMLKMRKAWESASGGLSEEVARKTKEIADLKAEVERLKKELAELGKAKDAELKAKDKELAELAKARDKAAKEARERIEALEKDAKALREEIERLRLRLPDAERAKGLDARLLELQAEIDKAKAAQRAAEERAAAQASLHADVLADVQRLINAIKKLEGAMIGGVGLKLERIEDVTKPGHGPVVVKRLLENGPAEQSGKVAISDTLLAVNGKKLAGIKIDDVRALVVGPADSTVTLRLQRPGEYSSYEVTLARSGGVEHGKGVEGAVNTTIIVKSLLDALREEVALLKEQVSTLDATLATDRGQLAATQDEASKLRNRTCLLEEQLTRQKNAAPAGNGVAV